MNENPYGSAIALSYILVLSLVFWSCAIAWALRWLAHYRPFIEWLETL